MYYNKQDYYIVEERKDLIIGLISDGCGRGANSEVGSKLCLQFITSVIANAISLNTNWVENFESSIFGISSKLG